MTLTSVRMVGKKPNPVDTHVGSRVRLRRMLLGMSQERLGESMGLTFQQVQKYEKGVNRIGASRLFQISRILDVPIQFFFEEAPNIDVSGVRGLAEPDSEVFIIEFLNSREGLELNRAFVKIVDSKVRKSIVDLVRALSAGASAS
jgi:transcriptional regulator with XRE-family HTH domain